MKIRFTLAILLGWLLLGPVAAAFAATGDVPPRPLTDQGLTNLTALTRLIGYVRFFHPSDQVAGLANADWDALAMAGVERVEAARNPRELAAALSGLFDGIAPTVRVLPFSARSAVELPENTGGGGSLRFLAWRHEGVDLHTPFTSYTSERVEVGRVPDGASADVAQTLDVERLRGHRVRFSAAVRFLAGAAGSAALNLQASTLGGSGSAAWSQPIIPSTTSSGGWQRVTLEANVPADATDLTLSFDLTGSGRLNFDDVKATADGLDVTGHLINPDLEEVVPGFPPRGWLLSHTPFGAEYSLSPVTGAAAGHWAAELSGPHVRPVELPIVADLGGGVSALVPVALPADDQGTFPHLAPAGAAGAGQAGRFRAERLRPHHPARRGGGELERLPALLPVFRPDRRRLARRPPPRPDLRRGRSRRGRLRPHPAQPAGRAEGRPRHGPEPGRQPAGALRLHLGRGRKPVGDHLGRGRARRTACCRGTASSPSTAGRPRMRSPRSRA